MIFAILNFTLSGIIGVIGILTLRKVSEPKEVVFASLPLFFALHQFTEGFVWLGVNHLIGPRAFHLAGDIFVFYAQGLLPFLVSAAIWLIEPKGWRKEILFFIMLAGLALTGYSLWGLALQSTTVNVVGGVLHYDNPWTANMYDAVIYVITTCGALILSSSVSVQLFGWLNLIGLSIIAIVKPDGFTSVWCLYAAVVSGLLYFYFVERRIVFLRALRTKEEKIGEQLAENFEEELAALEKRRSLLIKKVEKSE